MRYFLLICFLFFGIFSTKAQKDGNSVEQLAYTYFFNRENAKLVSFLKSEFLQSKDPSKKIFGLVYMARVNGRKNENEQMLRHLEAAKKLAQQSQNEIDKAYIEYAYLDYYLKFNFEELFIQSFNRSVQIFAKHKGYNTPLAIIYQKKCGFNEKNSPKKDSKADFYHFNQYALKSQNPILVCMSYNDLGYYHSNQYFANSNPKDFTLTHDNYQQSFEKSKFVENLTARNKILIYYYNNMGASSLPKSDNNYQTAFRYYNKALELIEKDSLNTSNKALVYSNIGFINAEENNHDAALKYLFEALDLYKKDPLTFLDEEFKIMDAISEIYAKKKQFAEAYLYNKKANDLRKSEFERITNSKFKSLEIFYQTQKKDEQIKQLKIKDSVNQRQKLLYFLIIFLGICAVVFLIFLLRNLKKISVQKTSLLESENQILAMSKEQLQKQTIISTLQLERNNDFIKELKRKIKDKEDLQLDKVFKEEDIIADDFNALKNIVQEVHPDFFKKLNEVATQKLTNLDLKYASYIYLNMDNQQISNILKADPNTVRTTKYRLKQKLGLNKNQDLRDFLREVGGN